MQFVINEKFPKTYAIQYYDTSDSQKLNNFTSFLRREIFIDKKFLTHIFFSLISSIFHKISNQISIQRNESFNHSKNFNLIDDSVLEDNMTTTTSTTSNNHHNSLHLPTLQSDTISTGSSDDIMAYDESESSIINNLDSPLDNAHASFQGCVRRKTVLKDFRKPTVGSWQRYWLQIWANSLVYFPPKSFKGWAWQKVRKSPDFNWKFDIF